MRSRRYLSFLCLLPQLAWGACATDLAFDYSNEFFFREKLQEAITFAEEAHKNQPYGDGPYRFHLEAVAEVLVRFGFDVDSTDPEKAVEARILSIAAYLHDTIEDNPHVLYDHLKTRFGMDVALTVYGVTKIPKSDRAYPEDRLRRTIEKVRDTYPLSTPLKLADRIANVERSIKDGTLRTKHSKYIDDYPLFRKILKKGNDHQAMWDHLDRLLN